jgi:hypothetical protein
MCRAAGVGTPVSKYTHGFKINYMTPFFLMKRALLFSHYSLCYNISLPGWYNGKTLDNRAGGRGFDPRSS